MKNEELPPIDPSRLVAGPPPVLESAELDDEVERPPVRRRRPETEMDMTPMVDVVFLLLIFFMVTAAFGMQKSIRFPHPEDDRSSSQARMTEDREPDEMIVVHVTRENRVFVEDEEAGTQQELYAKLRDRQYGERRGRHLLVEAEPEATHELVVRVLDAAAGVGMDTVRLKTAR